LKITKFLFIRSVCRKIYFLWFWPIYRSADSHEYWKKACNSTREWKG